jgi:hypothetical protein
MSDDHAAPTFTMGEAVKDDTKEAIYLFLILSFGAVVLFACVWAFTMPGIRYLLEFSK